MKITNLLTAAILAASGVSALPATTKFTPTHNDYKMLMNNILAIAKDMKHGDSDNRNIAVDTMKIVVDTIKDGLSTTHDALSTTQDALSTAEKNSHLKEIFKLLLHPIPTYSLFGKSHSCGFSTNKDDYKAYVPCDGA
jgi:hypothetical protein